MAHKLTVAVAAVRFAAEAENYVFSITGYGDQPALELSRFMEIVDSRIEDLDPFSLSLKAAAIFEGASCQITGHMDCSDSLMLGHLAGAQTCQMRTI